MGSMELVFGEPSTDMQILFVAAEAAPLAKVGGMGDVVGTLPGILRKMGHDVRILIPYYGFLPDKIDIPDEPVWSGSVMSQDVTVHETVLPETDVPLYVLGNVAFIGRHIYGGAGEDWRFTLFANGATQFILEYWQPEVVHCHDWHTGMIPVWLHQSPRVKTVFTIHNLAYQGPWRDRLEEITWCPPWFVQGHNTLAAALLHADRVNAVSPTYAEQIKTPEYGENLAEILNSISDRLLGILNGIDQDSFNPAKDALIPQQFTLETLENRRGNKIALQEELGLEVNSEVFLMGMVTRLVEQKGLDLVLQVLEPFLIYTDAQFIVLGTGDPTYETELWQLSNRFSQRMSTYLLYSDALAQRIYAGADALLMPSRFEPCGISQMIAMRYGCVPIVRRTGGLVDTVIPYDPVNHIGTGYCFDRYEPLDLLICLTRAWEGFRYKQDWQELQQRGMQMDFSWDRSAKEYVEMYQSITSWVEPKLRVPA